MKILVIDIETTGFDLADDCIVEIAAVLLNTRTQKKKKKLNAIIRESDFSILHEHSWIFRNSSLTFDGVCEKGFPLDSIRKKLQKLIDRYAVTAYNSPFDFSFLRDRGFIFRKVSFDPMPLLTNKLKIGNNQGSYKWPSVQETIEFFDWGIIEPHRALEDAMIEADIILEIIKRGWY